MLTAVSQAYNARNGSALARLLGVTRSSVSQTRRGHRAISPATAIRIADLMGWSPLATLAAALHAQAKTDAERRFWSRVYRVEAKAKTRRKACLYQGPPAGWNEPQQ